MKVRRKNSLPKLVVFDLDGTLAESKQPLTPAMAELLSRLLSVTSVAIISGGALSQFLKQVLAHLPSESDLAHLYLLPTSGSALYTWRNEGWDRIYEERLSETEKETISTMMHELAEESGIIDFSEPAWGERIEYRGGQVTLSALGQEAPLSEKKLWDPDRSKRRKLQTALATHLPQFSVAMGGTTTIDVTKKGIDKAYGIHQLSERLKVKESDILYVGDELVAGGNDEAVFKTGAQTHAVKSPEDTADFIRSLLR